MDLADDVLDRNVVGTFEVTGLVLGRRTHVDPDGLRLGGGRRLYGPWAEAAACSWPVGAEASVLPAWAAQAVRNAAAAQAVSRREGARERIGMRFSLKEDAGHHPQAKAPET